MPLQLRSGAVIIGSAARSLMIAGGLVGGQNVGQVVLDRLLQLRVGARARVAIGRQRLNCAVWRKRMPSMCS